MAQSTYVPGLGVGESNILDSPRHSAVVRVTHWLTTITFIGLLVSGTAILLVQPSLYWGETGSFVTPSLIDLPFPYVSRGQSGWGRHLHFLCAWVGILTGLVYVVFGLFTRHFRKNLLPARGDFSWSSIVQRASIRFWPERPLEDESLTYNAVQRITYLGVIFVLFPVMIWTGFAMSPGITSVFPVLVNVLGGHQSARTIHFCGAVLLVAFLFLHIAMVCLAGFMHRVGGMITGHVAAGKEPS
ncbi:MAG: cytochrome b/b6 domain-containing protein [Terriglobia bacterium]|jgi:thiosulfate reductase cytochrome b subunit